MALGISTYVDPGVYVRERIQPSSVTVTSDRVLGIVGLAPRTVRIGDEAVVRGKIMSETLSLATSTPYIDVLTSTCDRDRNNAVCYRNGQALALGAWSFNAAVLTGDTVGAGDDPTLDLQVMDSLTLSMDGKDVVTLDTQALLGGATETLVDLVAALNTLIVAETAYGATYGSVFTVVTTTAANDTVVITSPAAVPADSDIKIFMTLGSTADMASLISNTAWAPSATVGVQATTVLRVADAFYNVADVYTVDYIAVDSLTDALVNAVAATPLDDILSVGSFPGGVDYAEDTDYKETDNTLDWDLPTNAQASITAKAGTYAIVLNSNDDLVLSINGLDSVSITFVAGLTESAATLAARINVVLEADSAYGPEYAHVATDAAGTLVLTAPLQFDNFPKDSLGGSYKGGSSSIILLAATTCSLNIFLIDPDLIPKEYAGVGTQPTYGSAFYVSYDSDRASTDYDAPQRVYSPDQLYEYTSPLTMSNYTNNSLAVAGEIAFENGASSMYLIQIDDTVSEGYPTQNEVNAAIDVAGLSSVITDVVVVDAVSGSEVATDTALMNHVSSMSSLLEKKYRRGWFGMPRGTDVGDPDSVDTFVYRAVRTLQPGNTSPGRGRLMLCAPSEVSRTLTTETGAEVTVELDGKYLAVANAALFCTLPSPADPLLGKFVQGFLADSTFETYLQAERYTLASNGVNVTTMDAGNAKLLDPLTTEAGGGKVVQFEEPSSSAQKDAITRSVEAVLDANVKGLVPDDLDDFVIDIKTWVGLAIKAQINAGVIAPYRNVDGTTRELDFTSDIQALIDSSDPRTFTFKYYFNLKYVAKRFFGEYSVDNPFFS